MDKLKIDMQLCIHCDICIDICADNAISKQDGIYSINQETCRFCKACTQMCPGMAISEDSS